MARKRVGEEGNFTGLSHGRHCRYVHRHGEAAFLRQVHLSRSRVYSFRWRAHRSRRIQHSRWQLYWPRGDLHAADVCKCWRLRWRGHDDRFEDGYASATRRLVALVFHCVSTFSKNCSARGSLDCPSQNIACFRTAGFRLFCATSISFGTPSSFGNWLSAKTAFFFTSVSGSFSIAPLIVPIAFFPAFCASQKSACPRTCELRSSSAMRIISSRAPVS